MQVTTKTLPQSKVEITVVLPWEEWRKEEEHAVEHLSKQVAVAGFRKGKVPKTVLEGRLGQGAVLAETAEHAVEHAYPRAIVDAKVEAIGRPEVRLDTVKEGEPLSFVVTTAVLPEVKMAEWRKAVQKVNQAHAKRAIEVAEADIDAEIKRLAEMRAKFVTVNRPAREGDSVEIDFTVAQNGVPIEGGVGKKHPLVLGSKAFIPGFEEAIVGMQAGEEKKLELTFPVEYHAKHLAGKPALFEVKLLLVQEREIPVVDDAFVKNLGRFETVMALRASLKSGMQEEKKRERQESHRSAILDQLMAVADLEYPEILVAEEQESMLRQFRSQVENMGFSWETYLTQLKKTEAALREEWQGQAKKRIAAELILQKLAADEEMEIDSSEIEAEMNKVLQYYKSIKGVEDKLDLERLYASVRGRMLNEKVLAWLEKL